MGIISTPGFLPLKILDCTEYVLIHNYYRVLSAYSKLIAGLMNHDPLHKLFSGLVKLKLDTVDSY